QRAVGREVGIGLVLADRLRVLPLLGVRRVARAHQAFGLVLELVVGPDAHLVATAFHAGSSHLWGAYPAAGATKGISGRKPGIDAERRRAGGQAMTGPHTTRPDANATGPNAGARRSGATAAAVLPAALAGALLVAAPFAGTTTAPLAKS